MLRRLAEPPPPLESLGSILWRSTKEGLGTAVGTALKAMDYPGSLVESYLGLARGAETLGEKVAPGTLLPKALWFGARVVEDPLTWVSPLTRLLKGVRAVAEGVPEAISSVTRVMGQPVKPPVIPPPTAPGADVRRLISPLDVIGRARPPAGATGAVEGAEEAFAPAVHHWKAAETPPTPTAAQQRTSSLLEAAQKAVTPEAPTGTQATLKAAEEFTTGKALDLGEVGRRRAAQRAAQSLEERTTQWLGQLTQAAGIEASPEAIESLARRLAAGAGGAATAGLAGLGLAPSPAEAGQLQEGETGTEPVQPVQAGMLGDLGKFVRRLLGAAEREAGPEAGAAGAAAGAVVREGWQTAPRITHPEVRDIAQEVAQKFEELGLKRDPNKLISDQIKDMIADGTIANPRIPPELRVKASIVLRQDVSYWARSMAELSNLEQKLQKMSEPWAKETLTILRSSREAAKETEVSLYQKLTGVWKTALVTQMATAVRNAVTQAGNLGLHTIEKAMEAPMQRVFTALTGKAPADPARTFEGLEAFWNLARPGRVSQDVERILEAFPAERARLLTHVFGEVPASSGQVAGMVHQTLDKAQSAYSLLAIANNAQELAFRRAIFAANLESRLQSIGLSLRTARPSAMTAEQLSQFQAMVAESVTKARELTWAASPQGPVGRVFVEMANRFPGAAFFLPFPRFLTNAVKWTFEHSPYGILSLLKSSERAALAAGDMSVFSKAMTGTGMLLAAWQFRQSQWAGEKWYEAKAPDGRVIDLRPFNPFAGILFMVEAHRALMGRRRPLSTDELTSGFSILGQRAGAGLALIDDALAGLHEVTQESLRTGKGERFLEYLGQVVSGFLTPLGQVQDVLDQFSQWQGEKAPVRVTRGTGFTGPIKAKIPGMETDLPAKVNPTTGEYVKREDPALRQLLGLTLKGPKTLVEKELDRHEFTAREILSPTGDGRFDQMVASNMGPKVQTRLENLILSGRYQAASPNEQAAMLRNALDRIRREAHERALRELKQIDPERYEQIYSKHLPDVEREAVKERYGRVTPETAKRFRERMYRRD